MYYYFVFYTITKNDGSTGYGNGVVRCEKPITNFGDIKSLEKRIKDPDESKILIANFILIKEVPSEINIEKI